MGVVMGKAALIVVDMQRDFCEGGALAASDTKSLMEPLEGFIAEVRKKGAAIVFTQDWHPETHSSFKTNGGPWPVHCVAGSAGAELMPPIQREPSDVVIHKGVPVDGAGYSGFEATGLAQKLRALGIERVGVVGVATEYCVRATALDAAEEGFETVLVSDMVRPVQDAATAKTMEEVKKAGVGVAMADAWLSEIGKG
jgi:nicotinamidase/pyrazinamidase